MRSCLTDGNSFGTVSISFQFVVPSILSTHKCTAEQIRQDKVRVFEEATIEVNQKKRGRTPDRMRYMNSELIIMRTKTLYLSTDSCLLPLMKYLQSVD